ncbi:redoxin family protein [Methylosinus sp. Sm6]|uniref:redoxin family protein n=1 Tax=Methylosinus sp. Sm6 TaxID=2866948 RepID=UPI001C99D06D|nr:redoxin family protein [Methylosinus sp. Sm6]MBY6240172.1 redoxin family protein [Methylosinus sp. Sm6]
MTDENGREASVGRRGFLLAAGAGLAAVAAIRADVASRLFNPLSLDSFELGPSPGLLDAAGRPLAGLSSTDLAGRRSVLNFWASWCPSCREEHQLLVEFARLCPVPVYGAAVRDAPDHVRDYLAQHGNPYAAVGLDSRALLQRALGARGVPTTFVIGPGPSIELALHGPLDPQILAARLLPALSKAG